jgi:hypothetical protein
VHADADVHDTPYKKVSREPGGVGVRRSVHDVPSQCSAIDVVSPLVSWDLPTATHAGGVLETGAHETAANTSSAKTVFGEGWIDQPGDAATAPAAETPRAAAVPTAATKARRDKRRVSPVVGSDIAGIAGPLSLAYLLYDWTGRRDRRGWGKTVEVIVSKAGGS